MDDKNYYKNIYLVDVFVQKWGRQDSTLKYQLPEIKEDARSYAYMYWLQLQLRFKDDEKQVSNYYYRTIHMKLDGYLNSFYKNQLFQRRMVDGVAISYRENPLLISMDETDEFGRPMSELALQKNYPELVTTDDHDATDYRQYVDLFIREAPPTHRELVTRMTDNALTYSDEHPESTLATRAGAYNIPKVAEDLHLEIRTIRNMWFLARTAFVGNHPEIRALLREQ